MRPNLALEPTAASSLRSLAAAMFGVFSPYELQVIHDWIRGRDSAEGHAYGDPAGDARRPSFRGAARLAVARGETPLAGSGPVDGLLDIDPQALKSRLDAAPEAERNALMTDALSPSQHWTPAGLYATQLFCKQIL